MYRGPASFLQARDLCNTPPTEPSLMPDYPWPASAITPDDMAVLHAVRETSRPRVPISVLVARAIRETYRAASPYPDPEPVSEPGGDGIPSPSAVPNP